MANQNDGAAFEMTRDFDAPRDLVWKAWSEPARLQEWWGPKGCKVEVKKLEFRPGGFFHYVMSYSSGAEMWGRFMYREIEAPHRLVWLNSFSNPGCGITRAPFSEECPFEMLNVGTFKESGGKTTIELRSSAHGANEAEEAFYRNLHSSLAQGYGGTMDQLRDYLARV
jgi:uncharacterized protein YndB with AHSA1/START domain